MGRGSNTMHQGKASSNQRFKTEKQQRESEQELSSKAGKELPEAPQRYETGYFKKKSNSVNQPGAIAPTNKSCDNMFAKNLDILVE